MSTEREDGPVKHYRYVCDKCGKQSKRDSYEPGPLPKGWLEDDVSGEDWDCDMYGSRHYCPKCSYANLEKVEEIVPKLGQSFDLSDHDAVYRPLVRLEKNKLVIDLQDGKKLIITSNTAIKVEQIDDDA